MKSSKFLRLFASKHSTAVALKVGRSFFIYLKTLGFFCLMIFSFFLNDFFFVLSFFLNEFLFFLF